MGFNACSLSVLLIAANIHLTQQTQPIHGRPTVDQSLYRIYRIHILFLSTVDLWYTVTCSIKLHSLAIADFYRSAHEV